MTNITCQRKGQKFKSSYRCKNVSLLLLNTGILRTLENIQVLKIILKVHDFYEEEKIMTFLSPTKAIPPLCGPWLSLCFVKSPCEIILPIHTVFYAHIIEGVLWDYPFHHLCIWWISWGPERSFEFVLL